MTYYKEFVCENCYETETVHSTFTSGLDRPDGWKPIFEYDKEIDEEVVKLLCPDCLKQLRSNMEGVQNETEIRKYSGRSEAIFTR